MAYDEKTAERVRQILSRRRGVVERRMMGALAFLVNGSMCCSVGCDTLLVRVGSGGRERALASTHVKPMKIGPLRDVLLLIAAAVAAAYGLSRFSAHYAVSDEVAQLVLPSAE